MSLLTSCSTPRSCPPSVARSSGATSISLSCECSTLLSCHAHPLSNSLMWESHLHAVPTTLPLFWGDFASDPVLYTSEILDGFDSWIGAGQLLSAPALYESMFSREVYFPKSSPDDNSVYFNLNAPHGKHIAGTRATIPTPYEHSGLFAREGAVIPIGKDYATVTQTSGAPRTHADGVDVVLESEGGVVGLDDWRGVRVFPGTQGKQYVGTWTEDDGIAATPGKAVVEVTYTSNEEDVVVSCRFVEKGYKPMWGAELRVMLPVGDERRVKGMKGGKMWGRWPIDLETGEWHGRVVHIVEVE